MKKYEKLKKEMLWSTAVLKDCQKQVDQLSKDKIILLDALKSIQYDYATNTEAYQLAQEAIETLEKNYK